MIVTSEVELPNSQIIDIYRGLWEIEETFSIFKGILKVRPIFAKTLEGIHAHFLICFTSLLILRILQKNVLRKTLTDEQVKAIQEANKYLNTSKQIIDEISKMEPFGMSNPSPSFVIKDVVVLFPFVPVIPII